MGEAAETVVRSFLAAWADPRGETLAGFLDDDAIWVDGPQGVRRGSKAIVDELMRQLAISGGVGVEIDTLIAADDTVMVEWHTEWSMNGVPISARVMAVFEVGRAGRIDQMRECYDLQSIVDQIEAATST